MKSERWARAVAFLMTHQHVPEESLATLVQIALRELIRPGLRLLSLPDNGEIVPYDTPCSLEGRDMVVPKDGIVLSYASSPDWYKDDEGVKTQETLIVVRPGASHEPRVVMSCIWRSDEVWVPGSMAVGITEETTLVNEGGALTGKNIATGTCAMEGSIQDYADEMRVIAHLWTFGKEMLYVAS